MKVMWKFAKRKASRFYNKQKKTNVKGVPLAVTGQNIYKRMNSRVQHGTALVAVPRRSLAQKRHEFATSAGPLVNSGRWT